MVDHICKVKVGNGFVEFYMIFHIRSTIDSSTILSTNFILDIIIISIVLLLSIVK